MKNSLSFLFVSLTMLALLISGSVYIFAKAPSAATISLNAGTTYQTITGWEVVAQAGQEECQSFALYEDALFDLAVNDLGINRVRLEIRSGYENPVDYAAQFFNGQISFGEWAAHWYETINDNSNPNVTNANGFQFAGLDHTVTNVVLPMKQRLEANGESLYINLNVVDFQDQGNTDTFYYNEPDEYAELLDVAFAHLDNTHGIVPDSLEVILEPDNTDWTATDLANAIVSTGGRLQTSGYTPGFVVPSTVNMGRAVTWFDQIVQVPGATQYISELSYHRYQGVSNQALMDIASRGVQYGIDTAMLEHIGSGYQDLHQDLKMGRNSAWQQFALAFCTSDNGAQLYWIDESNPSNPTINIGSRTRFLRQYFKFIRGGAERIEASTSNNSFDPVAFINADGKYVVVVKTNTGGDIDIEGLPAATYGVKYTTNSQYDVDRSDVSLGNGQTLSTNIPEAGVITIYAKSPSQGGAPGSVTISGPLTGFTNTNYGFLANVTPGSTTQPLTYQWTATGESPITNSGGLSDSVFYSWNTAGTKTVTVQATNAVGSVNDSHTLTILDPSAFPYSLYLPVAELPVTGLLTVTYTGK